MSDTIETIYEGEVIDLWRCNNDSCEPYHLVLLERGIQIDFTPDDYNKFALEALAALLTRYKISLSDFVEIVSKPIGNAEV